MEGAQDEDNKYQKPKLAKNPIKSDPLMVLRNDAERGEVSGDNFVTARKAEFGTEMIKASLKAGKNLAKNKNNPK